MAPLVGAVGAGNTVVLKPSESAPHTSKVLIDILSAVFQNDWVSVVEGDAQVAQALLKERWDYIFFDGTGDKQKNKQNITLLFKNNQLIQVTK